MIMSMQTNLLSNMTDDKASYMTHKIDHVQLCQWLKAVKTQRCKGAFTHLFNFFAPKIKSITRSKFPNETQTNEVLQETMSNVWRKAHLFNEHKGAPTTWVYTIMRNVTFDMLRKMKTNREDTLSDDIWPVVESIVNHHDVFKDHLEKQHLLNCLDQLSAEQQQVVRGYYLKDMTQEQLAEHLGLPLGTIKSRLRLALAKLKARVGEHND